MVTATRLRGPFLGPSGYDHHVREFARAIAARGVGVELQQLEGWSAAQLPYELRDPWFESLGPRPDARTVVHFSFPTQVESAPGLANVNFTMFEATRIPEAWAAAHDLADLVVVPTDHSRRAWIDSGVPESKLRLCPLGVRSDRFRPGVPPLGMSDSSGRPLGSYRTRFLNVSEVGWRKNLGGLLCAWLRATTPEDDAVLIVKAGTYSPGSMQALGQFVDVAQERAGKPLSGGAPVHFVHSLLPDADMPRLFALGTHYVSLSFGEGWDLAMIQAAASDLRLIVPQHTGYLAYLNAEVASWIPAREAPAMSNAASWCVPDEDVAVERIRAAVDGRDEPRASARDRVVERFTWDAAAGRLLEILDEAEAMTRLRRGD